MRQSIYKIYIAVGIFLGLLTACIEEETIPVDIVTNAYVPTLSEIEFIEKSASTVTWEGSVVESNGYAVTEKGIVWGTSSDLDIEKDSHKSLANNETGTFRLIADGLKGSTTYFFRLYATNKSGTGYSKEKSETTGHGLGTVTTFIVNENTKATTAIAGGIITSRGEGSILERGVLYSLSASMVNRDSIISKEEKDSFVCNLSGLSASSNYYVQAYVKNTFGIFRGAAMPFTTGSGMPELSDVSVTPESNKAQVKAQVLSMGDASLIQRGFCWNTTGNPDIKDNTMLVPIGADEGVGLMQIDIQPLESKKTYYVRAFAENSFGITYSLAQEFITPSDVPTVLTLDPTNVVNGTAVFGGNILNVGASNIVRIGVCYSTTNRTPTLSDATVVEFAAPPISNVPYPFNTDKITGLRGESTYYICAFATNGNGTSYGDIKTLSTPSIFTQESESFKGGTRIEGSSAYFVIGDKGYLLGGDIGPTYIDDLYSYNPVLSSNRWGQLNRYEGGSMKWQSVAVIDSRVFVLGGLGVGLAVKDDFYRYDVVGNFWVSRPTGPDPAYSRAGFSLNNEVVYVGGMKDMANNEVWAFNVNSNTWTRKADFPVNQYGGVALTINNNVYVGLGKNTSGVGNKQLWRSSGILSSWTPEPSEPELSGNVLAGAVFNYKIYVIDKSPSPTNKYTLFEYDPANAIWKKKSDLPNDGWNIQFMYSIRDRIYIGFADNDKVVSYDPLWDN